MAKLLRLRRGTDTQHSSFTGAEGEVTVNTTNDSLHVHDGTTAGGRELMRADKNNMPASGVTAGTYGSSSAIPAITVDAKGLVTSATTNAIDSTSISNGTSNVSVTSNSNVTVVNGGTTVGVFQSDGPQFNDNIKAKFGTGSDLAIFHDGGNSILDHAGTGSLRIVCNTDDQDITLESDNSSGSTTTYVRCDGSSGEVQLSHYGTQKLNTRSDGIDVTGTVFCDGLTCDGSAQIAAGTGTLLLKDNNNTGGNSTNLLKGVDNADTVKWYVGDGGGAEDLRIQNVQNGYVILAANNNDFLVIRNTGAVVPGSNNSQDLGDANTRWRNIYTNDLNLSNEGGANDVDGTWGSWTIQEGEDDLFLLNRRNGKKYKFNLSEVN